jgi:hypothetical protein
MKSHGGWAKLPSRFFLSGVQYAAAILVESRGAAVSVDFS